MSPHQACLDDVRYLLGFLPSNNLEEAPLEPTADPVDRRCEELYDLIPSSANQPYDMRDVVRTVVDDGDFFEYARDWAGSIMCGFARLGGTSVGIVGNQPAMFAGVLDIERGQAPGIQQAPWQTCTSISDKAWGFIENDTYKSAAQLIHLLIDVVSKNGNLLLNVGPHADGSIPAAARDTLLAMGQWLTLNGEAIYGSRPWRGFRWTA